MEQREGRVHRYKGHAVRKNVAAAYGRDAIATPNGNDLWETAFEAARQSRASGTSDIIPYWIFSIEGGATIERHVPALPLSRDTERFARLRHALTLYRLVFGQSRQEDLLFSLAAQMDRLSGADAALLTSEMQINLEPPRSDSLGVG